MPEKETISARERTLARKIADHPGRRVRAGRNPTHPRRQARGQLHQAGDRHRPVEGPAGRGETEATEERHHLRGKVPRRRAQLPEGPEWRQEENVPRTLAGDAQPAQARRPQRRVSSCTGRQARSAARRRSAAAGRRQPRRPRAPRGRPSGGRRRRKGRGAGRGGDNTMPKPARRKKAAPAVEEGRS